MTGENKHLEEKQQNYMQFQMLQQQIEQASQQLEAINQAAQEIDISQEALQQLEKTKVDTEVLATICPGIFVKANLKENQKLIVNVGSNTTVEKTVEQVVGMLEEQKKEMQAQAIKADTMLQQLTQQAMKLYEEIQ